MRYIFGGDVGDGEKRYIFGGDVGQGEGVTYLVEMCGQEEVCSDILYVRMLHFMCVSVFLCHSLLCLSLFCVWFVQRHPQCCG